MTTTEAPTQTQQAPEVTQQQAAPPPVEQSKEAPVKKQATLEHFSEEQINKRVQDNIDRFERLLSGKPPKEEAPEKKEDEKPAEEKAETPEEKPEKPVKKAKKEPVEEPEEEQDEPKPRPRKRTAPADDGDKLEKVVEKLADKITKRQEPAKESATLSKADVEKRRVFEQMAKDNPDDYAGLPEKFEKFVAQESKYKSKWEKENPGERYNPDDEAHAEFYDKYGIEYDNDAYVDARVELKSSEKLESFTKKQQEQQERARREQEATRQAERMTADIPKLLAKEVTGQEVDLDALESEDPVAAQFISKALEGANTLVSELAALSADPSKLDVKGNQLHALLIDRLEYYESQLSELPFSKTVIKEGGRTKEFATLDDFQQMNPADKKHYWTVYTHPEQTKKYIVKDFGALAKSDIERQEQLFKQRFEKQKGATSQSQTKQETTKPQAKRESPDISGGDRRVPPIDTGDEKQDDKASLMDKWFNAA